MIPLNQSLSTNTVLDIYGELGVIREKLNIKTLSKECEKLDKFDSQNTYIISGEVTSQLSESTEELYDKTRKAMSGLSVNFNRNRTRNQTVHGLSIPNDENQFTELTFNFPYKTQVIMLPMGDNRGFRRIYIQAEKDRVLISYTVCVDKEYFFCGDFEYNRERILINSEFPMLKEKELDEAVFGECCCTLLAVQILFNKIFNQKFEYEVREPTKLEKKRNVQKIRNEYKVVNLDYLGLDQIKKIFKSESNEHANGSAKSPHERRSHIRKLKSGKTVVVKSSSIKGGNGKERIINVK